MRPSTVALILVSALAACGSSGAKQQPDASMSVDAPACTPGGACTTNPGAPCKTGVLACQGDQLACVDGADVTDGATCATGMCTRGACLAPVTASSSVDVSTTPITPGRTCAESPAFSVTALTATGATLAAAPDAGRLVAADEVLPIHLQGAPAATAH